MAHMILVPQPQVPLPWLFSYSLVSNSWPPRGLQHTTLLCPSTSQSCSNSCPLSLSINLRLLFLQIWFLPSPYLQPPSSQVYTIWVEAKCRDWEKPLHSKLMEKRLCWPRLDQETSFVQINSDLVSNPMVQTWLWTIHLRVKRGQATEK